MTVKDPTASFLHLNKVQEVPGHFTKFCQTVCARAHGSAGVPKRALRASRAKREKSLEREDPHRALPNRGVCIPNRGVWTFTDFGSSR